MTDFILDVASRIFSWLSAQPNTFFSQKKHNIMLEWNKYVEKLVYYVET
jgi:hypothetical protein